MGIHLGCLCEFCIAETTQIQVLQSQLAQARQERDILKAAVWKYGQHEATCAFYYNPSPTIQASLPIICTCGLTAALGGTDG